MNEPNEPIHQHFVPRMLLRNFTDAERWLHSYDKNLPKRVIRKSSVKKFCAKNDLYTIYDELGNIDVSAEKAFAELEGKTGKIIKKIIAAARSETKPGLSSSEKKTLDWFFFCQFSRVPDWNEPILNRYFKNICDENPELLTMPEEDVARFRQGVRARALAHCIKNPNEKVLSVLENKGLTIAVAATGNESFVIGSNPVIVDRPGYYMFGRIRKDWLPIAPDMAVALSFPRGVEKLTRFGDANIRSFNEAVFGQSKTVAGNSRELIRRVVDL